MTFKLGDRVKVKTNGAVGVVSAFFDGKNQNELYRIKDPSHCSRDCMVWYEVEYDQPVWDGNFVTGYVATVQRGWHTSELLIPCDVEGT